jgi:hypothetical protein
MDQPGTTHKVVTIEIECEHGEPVYWNPYNQVVQCHRCGQIFEPRELDSLSNGAFQVK